MSDGSPRILTDADITGLLPPRRVIQLMQAHLSMVDTSHPAVRSVYGLPEREMVYSHGTYRDRGVQYFGHRAYAMRRAHKAPYDVTVIHDQDSGALCAVHVGRVLGAMRNGAAGAIACSSVVSTDRPLNVVLFGAGLQAWHQIVYLNEVIRFGTLSVQSSTPHSAQRFADRCLQELGIDAKVSQRMEQELGCAQVVVCATSASTSVFDPGILPRAYHINAIGSKAIWASEVDLKVFDGVNRISCDNLAQLLDDWPKLDISRSACNPSVFKSISDRNGVNDQTRSVFLCRGVVGFEVDMLAAALHEQPATA